jgi:hypothetical protein
MHISTVKLVYVNTELLHVTANHVAIIRDISTQVREIKSIE